MSKVTKANLVDYIISYETGDCDEQCVLDLFQHLVDTGLAWTMQGHYGRTATTLIDAGLITLNEKYVK